MADKIAKDQRSLINAGLDALLTALWVLIGFLVLTGGYRAPGFEIAQVDAFATAALILSSLRLKLFGSATPEFLRLTVTRSLLHFRLTTENASTAAALIAIGSSLLFFVVLLSEYRSFNTNAYDLGFVDQAIWSTAFLEPSAFLHSSLSKGATYLGEHFSPVLALIAPLYRLLPRTETLFVVQMNLIAIGAWLVWRLGRSFQLSLASRLLMVVCYLLYQPVHSGGLFTFREDLFFIPAFLGTLILIAENRVGVLFWFLAICSFFIKENAPIVTAGLGVWLLGRRRSRSEQFQGVLLLVLSLAVFFVVNTKITPHFSQGADKTVMVSRFPGVGGSFTEILKSVLIHPIDTAGKILGPVLELKTLKYVLRVLGPFMVLMIWSRTVEFPAIIAAALFAMNVLISPRSVGFHYELILVPFLFAALAASLKKMERHPAGLGNVAAITILCFLAVFGRSPVLRAREASPSDLDLCLKVATKTVPQEMSVATQSSLFPHMDHRRDIFLRGTTAEINEDVVILSPLPEHSTYATPQILEQVGNWDGKTGQRYYRQIWNSAALRVWCLQHECSKLTGLVQVLQDVAERPGCHGLQTSQLQ